MKKLTILICVLAMLLAFTGVASADCLIQDTIVVSGHLTTEPEVKQIGPYLFIEGMQASGTAASVTLFPEPPGASFSIDDEDAIIDLRTLEGVNWGRITIATDEGEVYIRFYGRTFDLDPETMFGSVAGQFRVVGATGEFAGLRGWGRYSGDAAPVFTLTFTGWFYIPPE